MWPDWVLNPGPLTYESGALPNALRSSKYLALFFGPFTDFSQPTIQEHTDCIRNVKLAKTFQNSSFLVTFT